MAELTDYIKIESYLKDVPDSFLMGEINKPQSKYPPVLVVAEYNRRKRMRNEAQAQQQGEPKSVVEDIKAETGLMSIPGAAQSLAFRDMKGMGPPPAEMQAMPQQQMQPQMAQGQMPMRMAEGGLVAFEQGGPIRAQTGMYTGDYRPSAFERFLGFNLFQAPEGAPTGAEAIGEDSQMVAPSAAARFFRSPGVQSFLEKQGVIPKTITDVGYIPQSVLDAGKSDTDKMLEIVAQQQAARDKETATAPAPAAATKPPPAAEGGLGMFKRGALPTLPDLLTGFEKQVTDYEQLVKQMPSLRAEAEAEYERRMPDNTKTLEDRILRKTEEIQKDKDMSFNDALISAGAAILKAPGTPGSLSWMGEGLSAFGTTLKEGKKEIRKSEDLLDQANIDLVSAKTLREQGKLDAADKKEAKALAQIQQSFALQNSRNSLAVQKFTAEMELAKLPSEIAQKQGLADYYKALEKTAGQPKPKATTMKDALEAREALMTQAMRTPGVDINDPQVIAKIEDYLKANFPGYTPINIGGPKIRGADAPATLPPGT
jgi:hypothetical protein